MTEFDQLALIAHAAARGPVRVLVTGSRDWPEERAWRIGRALTVVSQHLGQRRMIVVHGACTDREGRLMGADRWADEWAVRGGYEVSRHPANWKMYGRAAGPIRNQQMVDTAPELVLAFIRNNSSGASGCLGMARKAKLPWWVDSYTDETRRTS